MSFEEFVEQVKGQILTYLPEEYAGADIAVQVITKNNDWKRNALQIKRPEDRIIPNIYLDSYYQMYREGWGMDKILSAVAQAYQKGMEEGVQWQGFRVEDYDSVKDSLFITALNRNNNRDYLKDIVHKDIPGTDITAVLRVMCYGDQGEKTASFMVEERILGIWGVAMEDVYEQALRNTERLLPPKIQKFEGVWLLGEDEGMKSKKLEPNTMYILSNEVSLHGATAMLYPGLLQDIGKATRGSFFILPSSVHETILIRDNGEISAEEFQRMVMEVNRTKVSPDEVLSDEVYRYDYRERKLIMETDPAQTKEYIEQLAAVHERGDSMEEADSEELER